MKNVAFLLLSIISFGCKMNKEQIAIDWEIGETLPNIDNQKHIGVAGPITGIIANRLVVAAGANFPAAMPWDGGTKKYQKDVYLYDINSKGELKYQGKHDFNDSLAYAANITLNDRIISVGGERNGQATADVFVYHLENDKLIQEDLLYPDLPLPLTNGALTHVNNSLYFVGGENADLVSNKIYALDLSNKDSKWEEFMELPKALTHTILVHDDAGALYIIGGRKRNTNAKSDIYKDVYKVDVKAKTIQKVAELPEQLAAGTGVFYKGNILVFGGDNGSTFHQVEQLIADINLSTDEDSRKQLIEQKNNMQRSHPGFGKKVWLLNLKAHTWQPASSIIGDSPVTTTALLYDDLIIIPSGENKAGVRTNQILTGRLQ